ncbi:ankyrin repeat-containing domain protein [Aspergillus carlsbadensis]|nr:ankyrin repeat-containing domain protein [Aspergillus carlsbadensis]
MLLDLPAEILWEIWWALKYKLRACNALVQTCRMLYDTFNHDLFRFYIRRHGKELLAAFILDGREHCVRGLLAHGATRMINKTCYAQGNRYCQINAIRATPLALAVHAGHYESVKLLIEAGADPNSNTIPPGLPIRWAIKHERLEILAFLIESGSALVISFPDIPYENLLELATTLARDGVLKLLLPSAGSDSSHPFHQKSRRFEQGMSFAFHHPEHCKIPLFLEAMENVNDPLWSGYTPLEAAMLYATGSVVNLIVQHGGVLKPGRLDGEREFTLEGAVRRSCTYTVKALLDRGVSVDQKGPFGETALMVAVTVPNSELVQFLLDQQADVEARDGLGDTPLIAGTRRGYIDIMEQLLLAGADRNAADSDGYTALIIAIQDGRIDAVKALLETQREMHAATNTNSIDKPDLLGRTPLFVATQRGCLGVIHLLLTHGSKAVDVQTSAGRTPLSFATGVMDGSERNRIDIAELRRKFRPVLELLQFPNQATDANGSLITSGIGYYGSRGGLCGFCRIRLPCYDYVLACRKCQCEEGRTSTFDMCFECDALNRVCGYHTKVNEPEVPSSQESEAAADDESYILSDQE